MKGPFDFKPGWPTTFGGVKAFEGFVADFYCAWAERMQHHGPAEDSTGVDGTPAEAPLGESVPEGTSRFLTTVG